MGERLSRLRRTAGLRAMVRETSVQASQLIYPVFVQEGLEEPVGIDPMPGQARLPISAVGKVAVALSRLGVQHPGFRPSEPQGRDRECGGGPRRRGASGDSCDSGGGAGDGHLYRRLSL